MSTLKGLIVLILVVIAILAVITQVCLAEVPTYERLQIRPLSEYEQLTHFLYEQVGYDYNKYILIKKVIQNESSWNPSVQSYIIRNGERELSFGLAQIHAPSHPDITIEEMLNPYFSIRFIVKEFDKGNANKWTAYRNLVAIK